MLTKGSARDVRGSRPVKGLENLVQQVIESETFRAAPMMRNLLLYLWKRQGEAINEYSIAVDALGRTQDFDPKTDSTVRVQIARLRAKLKEFYEHAGESFPLRLSIPLGRYELQWVHQPPATSVASRIGAFPVRYFIAAATVCGILAIVCIYLLLQNHALKTSLTAAQQPLPRFWQSFVSNRKPELIVVPSPLYFSWPDHKVSIRDLNISDFSNWRTSPLLQSLGAKWGPPVLAQNYVGAIEMTAAIRVLQYLEKAGQQVQLVESRKFAADSFATQNTIFLGMPRTAVYLDRLLAKTNFYIAQVEPDIIRNRKPQPGEQADFKEVQYSVDRRVTPAIIVQLPTRPEGTRSLLLMGRIPTSLSSMLVTLEGLKLLDEQWVKNGSPEGWEMVIQAEVYRDTVLKFSPVAFRPIPTSFWK